MRRTQPGRPTMKTLIILNEPAYGNERTYNGLRLALSLAKSEGVELRVFLMGDSVTAAKRAQKTPEGYYNLERILKNLAPKGIAVGACGTCRAMPLRSPQAPVRRSPLRQQPRRRIVLYERTLPSGSVSVKTRDELPS
jgi:predicted peroxiredoxin